MTRILDEIRELKRDGWNKWPKDEYPEPDKYDYISLGGTLFYKLKLEEIN